MSAVALTMSKAAELPQAGQADEKLRQACNEFLGMSMFSQMLSQARESSLNSDLFNSSSEKVFRRQLDDVMIRNATSAPAGQSPFGKLGDALYRSLSVKNQATGQLDIQG